MTKLPHNVDFEKMAQTRAHLLGAIPLSALPRLSQWLIDDEGEIHLDIVFSRDYKGRSQCKGEVRFKCNIACQRCLEALRFEGIAEIELIAVHNTEAAVGLDSVMEPIITGGEPISLAKMVEDEILLLLPQAPKHDENQCTVKLATINMDLHNISIDGELTQ